MNNRILAAVICAVGVAFAAMFANAPTGVAGSQENQDHWEVSSASPSDDKWSALRTRVQRLEQRVATLENQTEGSKPSPEPVRSSVAATETWQTPTVVELAPSQPQTIGQYQSATTITQTTETVCTGGVCRPQTTNATGPLRRIFRR